MVISALNRNLTCMCVSFKDPMDFIPFCLDNGLDLLLLTHFPPKSNSGHWIVASYTQKDCLYANDPSSSTNGVNKKYRLRNLLTDMRTHGRNDEIQANYTALVFVPPNSNTPVSMRCSASPTANNYPFIDICAPKINYVLDPWLDRWTKANPVRRA